MPADLYSDAEAAAPAPAPEEEAPAPEEEEASPENEATAELPKAVLGGKDFKPGEEVVLEVVQVMENSVLVKYASEEGGYSEEGGGEEAAPEPAAGPMTSMME